MKRPPRQRRPGIFLAMTMFMGMGMSARLLIPSSPPPPLSKESIAKQKAKGNESATLPLRVSVAWADGASDRLIVPARLVIPRLGVNAPVEAVGLTGNRDMGTPSSPSVVSWYRFGARPGEPGSAVMAGHLDSATGPAVFWRLKNLRAGDRVTVVDSGGGKRTFTVTGTERVDGSDPPIGRIFGGSAGRRLNLITCGGAWDRKRQEYEERFVVYTELAPS